MLFIVHRYVMLQTTPPKKILLYPIIQIISLTELMRFINLNHPNPNIVFFQVTNSLQNIRFPSIEH